MKSFDAISRLRLRLGLGLGLGLDPQTDRQTGRQADSHTDRPDLIIWFAILTVAGLQVPLIRAGLLGSRNLWFALLPSLIT